MEDSEVSNVIKATIRLCKWVGKESFGMTKGTVFLCFTKGCRQRKVSQIYRSGNTNVSGKNV